MAAEVRPLPELLNSCLCKQAQLESQTFRDWATRMRERHTLHRKLWEYCYIAQALFERDMLRPGRRGLGFAVGQEPLAALFAGCGCEIVATDLDQERAGQMGWVSTGQHAARLEDLNVRGICPPDEFKQRVSFRVVDMNHIPRDLRDFDFIWSSCSFEHLGSIKHGKRFIRNMTRCLKPHGVAVHTTEFNVSSNDATKDHGWCVIFRRRDIEDMARSLRQRGFFLELDYDAGSGEADRFIDRPPYAQVTHLKLELLGYVSTSIGLICENRSRGALVPRLWDWWEGVRPQAPWAAGRRRAG
jgi:SAM-dependent methyltransferase